MSYLILKSYLSSNGRVFNIVKCFCWFNFFIGMFIKLVIKLSDVVYGWISMVLSKIGSYLF